MRSIVQRFSGGKPGGERSVIFSERPQVLRFARPTTPGVLRRPRRDLLAVGCRTPSRSRSNAGRAGGKSTAARTGQAAPHGSIGRTALRRMVPEASMSLTRLTSRSGGSTPRPASVTTLAGLAGSSGNVDGTGNAARFNQPNGVAADRSGSVYVADTSNHTIRRIDVKTGAVTTFAGLAGNSGNADGTGSAARFAWPRGVAVDDAGNVYVADSCNYTIRRISPAGLVTTLAGLAGSERQLGWNGKRGAVRPCHRRIAVDGAGSVYVADTRNGTIRKIVVSTREVTTLAGLAGKRWKRRRDGERRAVQLADRHRCGRCRKRLCRGLQQPLHSKNRRFDRKRPTPVGLLSSYGSADGREAPRGSTALRASLSTARETSTWPTFTTTPSGRSSSQRPR